jgi:hypothetical protein
MIGAETHKEYESALHELYDEFEPRGITEQDLTIKLANLRWEPQPDRSLCATKDVGSTKPSCVHKPTERFCEEA